MLNGATPFASAASARELYRKVIYADVPYPSDMEAVSKDFVKRLLIREPRMRLGSQAGVQELMRHRWFKEISFDALRRRELPAPFVPRVSSEADTSYFLPTGSEGKMAASTVGGGGSSEDVNVPLGREYDRFRPIFADF